IWRRSASNKNLKVTGCLTCGGGCLYLCCRSRVHAFSVSFMYLSFSFMYLSFSSMYVGKV
ncbi:unnamed protein product, partial [Brassica oleracea]